jgi:zinc and cadmium transporter
VPIAPWIQGRNEETLEASIAVAAIQAVAIAAALWLSARHRLLERGMGYLVSLAVGVLLATALLHILPEAIITVGNRPALWFTFLTTIFALFCFERIFATLTGHPVETPAQGEPDCGPHHHHHHEHGARPVSLIFGGMLHSFVDGVSVAAAFSAGRRIGWLTAVAITLHEVPHRMGDYALLRHLHVSPGRAQRFLLLIAAAAMAGVAVVGIAGHTFVATDWLLPVSSASFVYIALVNLMPELPGEATIRSVCLQLASMIAGAALVALILRVPGS